MPQLQKGWLVGFFSLALLVTACQPASEPDRLPPQETTISRATTTASPTALPTPTHTPFPTATPSPTATPILARTSQGDQLPTRSPTSAPTSTAIPAEEPVPSTVATRPLSTPTTAPVTEVDLPTLEESLVLLDRLDRRQVKLTSTPVKLITYYGERVSCINKDNCYGCEASNNKAKYKAEIYMAADGTITGNFIFWVHTDFVSDAGYFGSPLPIVGTVNSVTGSYVYDDGESEKVQAKLIDSGQKFEGTITEDGTISPGLCRGYIITFSLDRE